MTGLSDLELIEVYRKATSFHLSEEFIQLIEEEIHKRKLVLPESIIVESFEGEEEPSVIG